MPNTFSSLIPPQPEVLLQLSRLCQQDDPDTAHIARLISSDVAVYASILKVINSPYYGLSNQITSIPHALSLLGINQVFSMVRLIILRNTLSKTGRMERFWDTAQDVSQLSIALTAKLGLKVNQDDLYTLGMLHDCGLPLMVQGFQDYRDFLSNIQGYDCTSLQQQEVARYGFSHYQLGARMAERWFLPEAIVESIRLQPELIETLEDRIDASEKCRHLLSVLTLAQDISAEYRYYWRIQANDTNSRVQAALRFLAISEYDYLSVRESLIDTMQ
ncbi:HDOD domain-containing protein [Marinobacterium sediminicola]|uniref:HD-like signal output (HDOD) domain, no enzymatic activity n=1 Tax=Marinobacterium sediminicola TaxID=518898 RepID=A0ABY1RYY4_9GAMM|nr:HDOD domain-containing protein [Marinobacterium sediminicola]ULG69190.1 HDOD domain-containing protein [Marinobacterium sediminicola]SMR73527.1 HD-like signal output (HDOD) domain, no enzymatic activity [Marinobacterium sediminicola]